MMAKNFAEDNDYYFNGYLVYKSPFHHEFIQMNPLVSEEEAFEGIPVA